MKKSLAILGLLIAVSQPVFAQCYNPCNPCNPCLTGAACPVTTYNPCSTCLKIVPVAKTCTKACAVVPSCDPCNPCATGAAVPITMSTFAADTDYNCCPKRGFWRNFFSFR